MGAIYNRALDFQILDLRHKQDSHYLVFRFHTIRFIYLIIRQIKKNNELLTIGIKELISR
ncbi:hypothetical protein EV194_102288 [Natronoflexus pectinivorans]|uniref:Uncharacterized protein n=1 Tax=Natronoflexus pectinivorans TaxID=682526 RepID=A0A4R2GN50_9BACT|nr:hypothetical protein EV194_102288 [Natronoflexus pectinivorans]